jgi:hypothetical protein
MDVHFGGEHVVRDLVEDVVDVEEDVADGAAGGRDVAALAELDEVVQDEDGVLVLTGGRVRLPF